MKILNLNKIFSCVERSNVDGENRDASPRRYLLKFESFSVLSTNVNKKYESSVFKFNGDKWKMIIYPDGDESVEGRDHISVYLAIAERSSNWEVNATFSFLIFDQIHGKYVVMRGMEQRFDNMKSEWGFSKCISHETFRENYLVNDKCVLGVDVYIIKNHGVGECMSLLNEFISYKHQWMISKFIKLKNTIVYSNMFTVGGYKWKLHLYPTDDNKANGKSISIYLELVDAKRFDSRKRVQAKSSKCVKDKIGHDHRRITVSSGSWYAAPNYTFWGWSSFMPLSKLKDPKKNFIVEDCCIVEADVTILCVVNGLI